MNDTICKKCGSPEIYMSWNEIVLCKMCFEDLYSDAKLINKELAKEREE